jgi:hypothetical protein
MTTRTKHDPKHREAAPSSGASQSSVWPIEPLPSWREALAARPSSAEEGRILRYAARHPAFDHVLHQIALDDEDEQRRRQDRRCHTAGHGRIRI